MGLVQWWAFRPLERQPNAKGEKPMTANEFDTTAVARPKTNMSEERTPLDQVHAHGLPCPFCWDGEMERDGIMDGSRYGDGCSRPWYVCGACDEACDGEEVRHLLREQG